MAALVITASITDSTLDRTWRTINLPVTTAAGNIDDRIHSIATSDTTVTFDTNIGNAGYLYVENLDATNYVELGFATTVYYLKLLAGQVALLPIVPGTAALYLRANTAACRVEILVHEA